jgi:uncharacterized peroxidase-related enzyme
VATFRTIPENQADEHTARIFREILDVKHIRIIPNFFKTLANSPSALQGTWSVYRDVSSRGLIEEAVKEMIFVAISAAKNCAYCEAAHLAFCRILKVDKETCDNLVRDIDALRPARLRDIVRFAVKAGTEPKSLKQKDYSALRKHDLSDAAIIEIVAMAAFAAYAITVAEALKLKVDKWD